MLHTPVYKNGRLSPSELCQSIDLVDLEAVTLLKH